MTQHQEAVKALERLERVIVVYGVACVRGGRERGKPYGRIEAAKADLAEALADLRRHLSAPVAASEAAPAGHPRGEPEPKGGERTLDEVSAALAAAGRDGWEFLCLKCLRGFTGASCPVCHPSPAPVQPPADEPRIDFTHDEATGRISAKVIPGAALEDGERARVREVFDRVMEGGNSYPDPLAAASREVAQQSAGADVPAMSPGLGYPDRLAGAPDANRGGGLVGGSPVHDKEASPTNGDVGAGAAGLALDWIEERVGVACATVAEAIEAGHMVDTIRAALSRPAPPIEPEKWGEKRPRLREAIDAARSAKPQPRHVCGARGFADSGDTCPACAPTEPSAPPIEEVERERLAFWVRLLATDGDNFTPAQAADFCRIADFLRTSAPGGMEKQLPPIQFERELVEKEGGVLEWSEGGEQPPQRTIVEIICAQRCPNGHACACRFEEAGPDLHQMSSGCCVHGEKECAASGEQPETRCTCPITSAAPWPHDFPSWGPLRKGFDPACPIHGEQPDRGEGK